MRALAGALIAVMAVTGCKDKDPAPAAAQPKPAASGGKCPAGSTGDGSYDNPCTASGETRLVTLKFARADDSYIVFTATNTAPVEIIGGAREMWIYDGSGKRLDITGPSGPLQTLRTSGSITPTLKPGATAEVQFFLAKASRPAGASTYQAEFAKVEMSSKGGKPDLVWQNLDLYKGPNRPMMK